MGFAQVLSICSLSGLRPSENPPQGAREQETCHSELVSESHNRDDNAIVGHLSSQARTTRNDEEKPFNPSTVKLLNHSSLKKSAFTLAEVLITLGIIGVVAAMTLPTVVNNYRRTEAETRLKKTYSIVNQAFSMAVAKHGDVADWELDDAEHLLKKYLAPEIKGAKVYPPAVNAIKSMCYEGHAPTGNYVWMTKVGISTPFYLTKTASIRFPDGVCLGINPKEGYSKLMVFVDINGSARGPNMAGYDLFFFVINKNQVVPYGYNWTISSLTDSSKVASCHSKASGGGQVCAAYIMSQGWEINYW